MCIVYVMSKSEMRMFDLLWIHNADGLFAVAVALASSFYSALHNLKFTNCGSFILSFTSLFASELVYLQ